jgi:predicted secreted protein
MSNLLDARNGFGTILSLTSVGSSGTFKPIAGITSMNPPKKTLGVIDVTYYAAPGGYDQAIPGGIFKQSPIALTGIMITCSSFFSRNIASSTEETITMYMLKDFLEDGTRIGWKIEMGGVSASSSTLTMFYGDGYITDFGFDVPFNEKVTFSATITPTGKPTFGSST